MTEVLTEVVRGCEMAAFQFIFYTRSELALEKKMLKESLKHRRVVVPTTWFYEWNGNKEKLLPGESARVVYDRTPLLPDRDEIGGWLFYDNLTETLLQRTPAFLFTTDRVRILLQQNAVEVIRKRAV